MTKRLKLGKLPLVKSWEQVSGGKLSMIASNMTEYDDLYRFSFEFYLDFCEEPKFNYYLCVGCVVSERDGVWDKEILTTYGNFGKKEHFRMITPELLEQCVDYFIKRNVLPWSFGIYQYTSFYNYFGGEFFYDGERAKKIQGSRKTIGGIDAS